VRNRVIRCIVDEQIVDLDEPRYWLMRSQHKRPHALDILEGGRWHSDVRAEAERAAPRRQRVHMQVANPSGNLAPRPEPSAEVRGYTECQDESTIYPRAT
jgi:hypothetical protein